VGTGAPARPARQSPAASARASVDIMARSSGGSVLADGGRPSGKMEVAVAIGTDPAITFSAIVPAPPDIEEYLIAGFLRQKPVELVKCETVNLEVPATAEIILEGHVNLDELSVPGFSSQLCHASQGSDLLDHDCREAADGGWMDGQGGRAHFSSAHAAYYP
jgi:3-octaprenyl-4-hydroxybenzoate carboxy-lyase